MLQNSPLAARLWFICGKDMLLGTAVAPTHRSIVAGQQNHVIGEIERDLWPRTICKWDSLGKHDVEVPIIAIQNIFVISGRQLPTLERLGFDPRI
jgi:hypothetical protein